MTATAEILVVTRDAQLSGAIEQVAKSTGQFTVRGACATLDDLLLALDQESAPIVLVDVTAAPDQVLADLEPIVARFGDTRFLVVAAEREPDLLLRAMQSGVRHFLVRAEIGREVAPVIQRLMSVSTGRAAVRGAVVTVLGAGGGCGATTFTINLAHELGRLAGEPSLIIDLDTRYGGVASCLGIEASFGIADVLADGDRIDANLLRSTAHAHSAELHVLASPSSIDFESPKPVQVDHLGRAILRCREVYPFTVIDAPRVPVGVAAQLATGSNITYIVLEATVKDLRIARRLRSALVDRGILPNRIVPLVDKHRGRAELIRAEDVRGALGCDAYETLPEDAKSVGASINFGHPLAQEAPRSPLRAGIVRLAEALRGAVRTGPALASAT